MRQGKPLKTPSNEDVFILRTASGFSASLYFAGRIVNKSIPIIFHVPSIKSNLGDRINTFGLGAVLSSKRFEVIIEEDGIFKGESSMNELDEEITNLRKFIEDDIENTILLKEVSSAINRLIRANEFNIIATQVMPPDLRKRLQKFLNNIYRVIERNAIDINAAADIVDKNLSTIKIAKYWDEMNLFLELDCVKSLDLMI